MPSGKFSRFRKQAMKRLCWCGKVSAKVPCEKCRCKPTYAKKKWHYDHAWRVLSERFRADNPLCHDCDHLGVTQGTEEVHHIKPISEYPELRLRRVNLVTLCKECHATRHRNMRKGLPQWEKPKSWVQKIFLNIRDPTLKDLFIHEPPAPPQGGMSEWQCQNGSCQIGSLKLRC